MKQVLFVFFFLVPAVVLAQITLDFVQQLDEVTIRSDRALKTYSKTHRVVVLKDSAIARSASSLTDLLNANTLIYFKENGLGMVSSPSFRGSTASQTAVVWNGININSQFNGQTDFNTINILGFDEVTVRSGGGSVLYGSGAIGGSVHLDNVPVFGKGFQNRLLAKYGSFETQDVAYNGSYSNENVSANISASFSRSDNDYGYVDSDRSNLNGQFYNTGLSANLGYKINAKNLLKYSGYVYDGERHFSLIMPSETRAKYQDFNTRQLLEWNGFYGKFLSTLKLAYITERYKYFANIDRDNYTFGEARTTMAKYHLGYPVFNKAFLEGVADIAHTTGEGSSIAENKRTISGFSLLFKHRINRFYYETTLRKEITANYESPMLFSLGLRQEFGKYFALRVNGSKNFRIPTYNDLYWAGSGNPDLNPETSYQLEIGNTLNINDMEFSITGFYNDITSMIRWIPSGSVWIPVNTDHVVAYGLEANARVQKSIGKHRLTLNGNYGYTISEDHDTHKQLVYVPKHSATGQINYELNRFSAYWQTLYRGEVFLLSDNNPRYVLDAYLLNNFGLEYNLGKHKKSVFGCQIKNILNENYQSVDNRFMPGINYNFYLNFNI